MRVGVANVLRGQRILFGTAMGRSCLAALVNTPETQEAEILFLDFSDVESATVSFLREGPLAFRDHLRTRGSNLYPVFANLGAPVMDSLEDYLRFTRDAVFVCQLSETDRIADVRVLGRLDAKQNFTFDAVCALGEATATQLAEKHRDADDVGVTAWNNRLAALTAKGLLMECPAGRRKSFKAVLEVL